jgi:hypothetical protein
MQRSAFIPVLPALVGSLEVGLGGEVVAERDKEDRGERTGRCGKEKIHELNPFSDLGARISGACGCALLTLSASRVPKLKD